MGIEIIFCYYSIGQMGKATKSILVIVMITSLASMGLTSNQAFAGAPPPASDKTSPFLGDFKCYSVTPVDFLANNVLLTDQFVSLEYDIEDIIKICPMVFKEAGAGFPASPEPKIVSAPFSASTEQHFVVYELCDVTSNGDSCVPAPPVNFPVSIMDQFGTTDHVTPHIPVELWVPSGKDHFECPGGDFTFNFGTGKCVRPTIGPGNPCPPSDAASFPGTYMDIGGECVGDPNISNFFQSHNAHFKCYDIEPKDIGTKALTLFDENFFPISGRGDGVQIDTADKLCNPVIKKQEPNQSLDFEHLKCYDFTISDTVLAFLAIINQFHDDEPLDPIEGVEFCSAADKFPILVAGTLIPMDTTMVLLAGTQVMLSWIIPVVVAAVGFGVVIARKY